MQKRSLSSKRVTGARWIGLVLLRASLIVSLWQAPVPWMHSHDALNSNTAHSDFWADHLGRFHSQALATLAGGWHLHFVLPWELSDKQEDDGSSREVPLALCFDSVPTASIFPMLLRAEEGSLELASILPNAAGALSNGRHIQARPIGLQILLTYSGRISWRSLSGVARC